MSVRLSKQTLFWMRIGGGIGIIAAIGLAQIAFQINHEHATMPIGATGIRLSGTETLILAGSCRVLSIILIVLGSCMDDDY